MSDLDKTCGRNKGKGIRGGVFTLNDYEDVTRVEGPQPIDDVNWFKKRCAKLSKNAILDRWIYDVNKFAAAFAALREKDDLVFADKEAMINELHTCLTQVENGQMGVLGQYKARLVEAHKTIDSLTKKLNRAKRKKK